MTLPQWIEMAIGPAGVAVTWLAASAAQWRASEARNRANEARHQAEIDRLWKEIERLSALLDRDHCEIQQLNERRTKAADRYAERLEQVTDRFTDEMRQTTQALFTVVETCQKRATCDS